jgi:hypothetical protein
MTDLNFREGVVFSEAFGSAPFHSSHDIDCARFFKLRSTRPRE